MYRQLEEYSMYLYDLSIVCDEFLKTYGYMVC